MQFVGNMAGYMCSRYRVSSRKQSRSGACQSDVKDIVKRKLVDSASSAEFCILPELLSINTEDDYTVELAFLVVPKVCSISIQRRRVVWLYRRLSK